MNDPQTDGYDPTTSPQRIWVQIIGNQICTISTAVGGTGGLYTNNAFGTHNTWLNGTSQTSCFGNVVSAANATTTITQISSNQVSPQRVPNSPHNQSTGRRKIERAFNRYLNGSDLLEEFIGFCGAERVNKAEFLNLPIKLFMMWLILEAAKEDELDPPQDIAAKFEREMRLLQKPVEQDCVKQVDPEPDNRDCQTEGCSDGISEQPPPQRHSELVP